ncbi:hypothetical protein GGI35DRAFT_472570 [Trichoderma velutinum]
MACEHIDWALSDVVAPEYIATVRTVIEHNYPRRESKTSKSPYPKEHLTDDALSFYPWSANDEKILDRYNPFHLRIPDKLTTLHSFFEFDYRRCSYNRDITPAEERLNFLREYHILYADILEALNEDDNAESRLRTKIHTDSMYQSAGLNTRYLRISNTERGRVMFQLSLLAHLALDILRSREEAISTAARVKVLGLLYKFDIDAVAAAFSFYNTGFKLHALESVEDLIPKSFIKHATEKGGTPHNGLFMENSTIKAIFPLRRPLYNVIDFDTGLSTLLQCHRSETVQILLSFLRLNVAVVALRNKYGYTSHDYDERNRESTKLTFHALVNLSRLDSMQKRELFGAQASYRTGPKDAQPSSYQSRVGATTGVGGEFCDDLESLSKESLVARIRQQQAYIELLRESPAARVTKSTTTRPSISDPKGYCKIFGLDPRFPEALKWHPDKTVGDPERTEKTEKFKKLQSAYEVLSDSEQRKRYLAS